MKWPFFLYNLSQKAGVAGRHVVLHRFHHHVVPKLLKIMQETLPCLQALGPHRLITCPFKLNKAYICQPVLQSFYLCAQFVLQFALAKTSLDNMASMLAAFR